MNYYKIKYSKDEFTGTFRCLAKTESEAVLKFKEHYDETYNIDKITSKKFDSLDGSEEFAEKIAKAQRDEIEERRIINMRRKKVRA